MKTAAAAILALVLMSCDAIDTLKDGLAHAHEVASDLEKSVGSKPAVSFNWTNGSLTDVGIAFEGVPARTSIADIAALARSSVESHFEQEPDQVIISFTLSGSTQ